MGDQSCKRCASCGAWKPAEEFHRKAAAKDGLHTYCKPCTKNRNADWVLRNREKHRKTCADWYSRNKAKANSTQSCWHYRKSYGITKAQFIELVGTSGGRCAICKTEVVVGAKSNNGAALDHCHESGKIRGVLCNACNKGLGQFFDRADYLLAAAKYVKAGGVASNF